MKSRLRRILVVDDDPQVRSVFGGMLSSAGYEVICVDSGDAAFAVLRDGPVDLLILDLNMPDQPDGFEILKTARSHSEMRILVISGFMHGPLLKASELMGATASLD